MSAAQLLPVKRPAAVLVLTAPASWLAGSARRGAAGRAASLAGPEIELRQAGGAEPVHEVRLWQPLVSC